MSSRLEDMLAEAMPKIVVADLDNVMSSTAGRRFISAIVFGLARWGNRCYDPAIKEGLSASQHAAFLDGMQEVGRRLAYEARKHCRAKWRELERERLARDEQDEREEKSE